MKPVTRISLLIVFALSGAGCNLMDKIEHKAAQINRFEVVALHLAKENDQLKGKVSDLSYEIETLKAKNNFLTLQLEKDKTDRAPASIKPLVHPKEDLVKFDVYKWNSEQLLATATKAYQEKDFEKAAQYFQTLLHQYPDHPEINDDIIFASGLSAYETGKHDDWAVANLGKLVKQFPTSRHYRASKLWMAMTNLRQGKEQDFFATVEEFRKKYRNTKEWDILSAHYEKILQTYKN